MELTMDRALEDIDGKPKINTRIISILGNFAPIILILLTAFYVMIFQQDAVGGLLKKYDFIGVSETGRAEKYRLYQINNLPIPFEQREAIKSGSIFLGATRQMVLLAIGQPSEKATNEGALERWVYYLNQSSRPTYLFFKADKLVDAQKGTTLDNAEIQ
jgi:hypothetical protein